MSYLLQNFVPWCLLALLGWLPGYALERGLLRARDLGALRGLARWLLGACFWMAGAFGLAATGALNRGGAAALALAAAGAALAARLRWGAARPRDRLGAAGAAWLGIFAALLAPLFAVAASPELSWDADTYHLTLPRLFVEAGGFRRVPFNVYSNWPLGLELLFALALLLRDPVLAKLVHFGFGALALYAICAGCRDFRHPATGPLAAALFLLNPVVLAELTAAYVDLAHAFFFLCALLFALRSGAPGTRTADARAAFALAGLACGAAASLKVNGIASAPAAAALLLPGLASAARAGRLAPALRTRALWFGGPLLALWLPWLARSAWLTGDPFYPFLHAWLGGPDWSASLGVQLRRWQASIGMGREPLDYLLLPVRAILEGGPHYRRFDGEIGAFWVAAVPVALVFGLRRRLVRGCLAAAGIHFAIWAASSQQMRFLIPLLPPLAVAAAVTFGDVAERWLGASRGARLRWAAALLACAALPALHPAPFARAAGLLAHYRSDPTALRQAVAHPVYAVIDARLPADTRLLLLNTNHGFFLRREYLADSFFQASQVADWLRPARTVPELRRLLEARGVSHVLRERRDWGIRYPPALDALLRDPRQVERLYASPDGRFELFALRRDASRPAAR